MFGGGLMIGGRGLPTNLSSIETSADGIQVKPLDAPVDDLFSETENPKLANVEAAQKAIVERVELGDREALIGQRDRLTRLCGAIRDPKCVGRRSGPWAAAPPSGSPWILVKALDDPDIGVVIEAHTALCWFSRRPNAFKQPADPLSTCPKTPPIAAKRTPPRRGEIACEPTGAPGSKAFGPDAERNLPIDLP